SLRKTFEAHSTETDSGTGILPVGFPTRAGSPCHTEGSSGGSFRFLLRGLRLRRLPFPSLLLRGRPFLHRLPLRGLLLRGLLDGGRDQGRDIKVKPASLGTDLGRELGATQVRILTRQLFL